MTPEQAVKEHLGDLVTAWDNMDRAAQRVLTSLPSQIGEAAAELDRVRLETRAVVQRVSLGLS